MKEKIGLFILSLLILNATAANLNITAYSSSYLPVTNITVTIRNESGDTITNLTDLNGMFIVDMNGTAFRITLTYPSSAYSAKIDWINGSRKVFLGDVYGTTLRLVNTLGQPLEAQDCAVAIYRNDTNDLIRNYDTTCRQGERYVDEAGNWASITKCPLTDSSGYYYFYTTIKQDDGFQYGLYYTTRITCNAVTATDTFYVDVQKPPDVDMIIDMLVRYGGGLILAAAIIIGLLMLLAIFTTILLWAFKKRRK